MKERDGGEEQFGQLVVTLGYASPIEVSEAIRYQRKLIDKGEWKPLGQILVEQGVLSVDQVRQILLRQGKTLLVCRSCKSKFNLADPSSGDLFKCRVCGATVDVVASPDELEEEEEEQEDPILGATLAGCRIQELLWEDAISRSYRAWQIGPQRDVVMRILKERCAQDKELIKRFLKEAAAASKIRHPSICPVYDVGQAEGYFYVCHGYYEGPTLRERIESEGRLPVRTAASIILHIVNGMLVAHKHKVVHRDIRPENVLFPGGKNRPVILGLGLYKRVAEKSEGTEVGVLLGSPEFMAPEQIKDYSSADEKSDIFSIGALFFYALVGESPFAADNPVEALAKNLEGKKPKLAEITDGIPKEICYLVDKMLSRFPDKRFSSLQQVKTALESIKGTELPARKANVRPYSPSVGEGELRLADETEETYEHTTPDLELAPPEEETEPELKLAEPEEPEIPSPPEPPPKSETLTEEEKKKILHETMGVKEQPPSEVEELEGPPEEAKQPEWKKVLTEKAPFIALGVVALIIVIVLVIKLGGESEPVPKTPQGQEMAAQREYRRLLKYAKQQEREGYLDAIIREATRLYNKYINTPLADRFLEIAERYRQKLLDRKVMEKWTLLKKWLEENKQRKGYIEEAKRRVKAFISSHADHPLANEARKILDSLESQEHITAAKAEVEDAWKQVKETCGRNQYVTAYKLVEVQELRLQQRYRQFAAEFADSFKKMRSYVVDEACKFFEEAKKRAALWEQRGKVDKALEELDPFVAWLEWEKRGEGETLAPLIQLAHKARTAQDAIKARFKRGMMRARILFDAFVHQASAFAAEGKFEEAGKLLQRAETLAKKAKLRGNIAVNMLRWLQFAKRFSEAHIEYLKGAIGKQLEVKTTSNIPYEGTLESFDGGKLGIRVQTGRIVYVPLEKVKEEYLRKFARSQMGEQDGRLGEAALAYFRGEGDETLLEGVIGETAEALRTAFRQRSLWNRVKRIIWLFNGSTFYKLRRERAKISVVKFNDEFGNALRLTEGSLTYTDPLKTDYIIKLQFCCKGGKKPLKILLPLGTGQSVALLIPPGGKSLSFKNGEATTEDVSIRLGEWFQVEIFVVSASVSVFIDGQKVLETKTISPKSSSGAKLSFQTEKDAHWLLRQIYLTELK